MQIILSQNEVEVLRECNVMTDNLSRMPGKKVHDFMIYNNAFTDGEKLIFFERLKGGSTRDHNKFLYYIGAENEAEIEAKFHGITVYGNIDEDRLNYKLDDEQIEIEEET